MSQSPLQLTYGTRIAAYLSGVDDFRKYRRRISKALQKTRRDLDILTKDTKRYAEKEQTKSISAENYAADSRYATVLLLTAERDSAYALEIKAKLELNEKSAKKLMQTRLKRAVSVGRRLLDVVAGEADKTKKLEFFLFASLNHGVYAVSRKKWLEAVHALSVARCGLELLAQDEDMRTTATELLELLVDPLLGMAKQLISGASDLTTFARDHCHDSTIGYLRPAVELIAEIDPLAVQQVPQKDIPKEVTWRGHSAGLHNDELAAKIAAVRLEKWQSFSANDYDTLQSSWSALVDLHQQDVQKNADDDDVDRVQDDAIVLTFLNYNFLFAKLKRDLLVIDSLFADGVLLRALKNAFRVYDSILQTVELLKDLPGVHNDDDLYESLESMSVFFTAKKSAAIADAYNLANRFSDALAVYQHLSEKLVPSPDFYKVSEFPYSVTSNDHVSDLAKSVKSKLLRTWALAQYQRQNAKNHYLIDNVTQFPLSVGEITNAAKKSALVPVPSKAVLFDVAFNYISYTSGEESVSSQEPAQEPSQEGKKKGLFGIFGR